MKNIVKTVAWFITSLFLIAILFTAATNTHHTMQASEEIEQLKACGYYNPVSVGDYCLNVAMFGNENGKHTIIGLAGLGMGDFSVAMRQATSVLEEDNLVVFVDRAGYGLSDDTNNEMTVEYIVEDYRQALKNAGIKAPYILMPHSIGGVYATYWVSHYPEEIEAVVFLDGTQLSENAYVGDENEYATKWSDRILTCLAKLGFSRYMLRDFFYQYPDNYTEQEQYLGDALTLMTEDSIALLSEIGHVPENARKTFDTIVANDVPKLYMCASWGYETKKDFVEHVKWMNRQREINNLGDPINENPDDATVNKLLQQSADLRQNILIPYLQKMGNCELGCLGGDHMIYEQKPVECGKIVKEFVDSLH